MARIFRLVSKSFIFSHVLKRLFSSFVYIVLQAKQIKVGQIENKC